MSLRVRGESIRRGAVTLVVLAAAVLALPSESAAGCSHYAVAASPDAGPTLGDLADRLDAGIAPRIPPGRPGPCDGPSCSGRPAVPSPTPIVPRPPRGERWGCLTIAPARDEPSGRPLPRPEAPAPAAPLGLAIERPPRS